MDNDELTTARTRLREIIAKRDAWAKAVERHEMGADGEYAYYAALVPGWERHVKVLEERSRSDHTQHG